MDNCEIIKIEDGKLICVCMITGTIFEVALNG